MPAPAIIMAWTYLAITCKLMELESYSNL